MTANLDTSLGFHALAFTGPRSAIWHGDGQSIDEAQAAAGRPLTFHEIWKLAGCSFHVEKVPLLMNLAGDAFNHLPEIQRLAEYPDRFAHVRQDTGAPLGMGSDVYKLVQPDDIRDTFQQYVDSDDRFHITTVGALNGGRRIWAQAEFNGSDHIVAGDKHRRHLLMSTTFDSSGSTRLQGSETRVVCENTIAIAMGERAPVVNIRHNAKFDAARARRELAAIAKGFDAYKELGDALAGSVMGREDLTFFLRDVLDIPRDATLDDVSTRKKNQRQAIVDAITVSANERGIVKLELIDAFTTLQGVTRWVDHTRDSDDTENRMFGSGMAFKQKALGLLMPRIADKVAA